MKNHIWMKRSSEWYGELWREALALGNGLTGASLVGSVGEEHLLMNRYDLWVNAYEGDLPDVSHTLSAMRNLIDKGEYTEANTILADALQKSGYRNKLATPMPLGELNLQFENDDGFTQYRRGIVMDKGYAYVTFRQGQGHITRRCFVSRANDTVVLDIGSKGSLMNAKARLQMYQAGSIEALNQYAAFHDTFDSDSDHDGRIWLKACIDGKWHGAAARVFLPQGGIFDKHDSYLEIINAPQILIMIRCFSSEASPEALQEAFKHLGSIVPDFETLLVEHAQLHYERYSGSRLTLSEGDLCNDELLDEAYESVASAELINKLWQFGRYLFISGTSERGHPFPLYGLWNGSYQPVWAQNVANENVQMIYWHVNTGNLCSLARPLIEYYHSKMDFFHESAQRMFGCRGIYVSTYTTPYNSFPAPPVPVILNFVSVAGWLSQHFYNYYRYTGDMEMLRDMILPFMLESAQFYEDYLTRNADGKIRLYPSVSPENSPANFIPESFSAHFSHPNPITTNATMEIAILKELLTNLLEIDHEYKLDEVRVKTWKNILKDLPDYAINEDGAVKEWLNPELRDFYKHRHLSHLYPVFPGNEKEVFNNPELLDAFKRAVDLRELDGQSNWSLMHMACIYARFRQAEKAISCLDFMVKGCLLRNFFTLSNDYRDMGVTLKVNMAPVQLDAVMGTVNAIQEMLLFVSTDYVRFLPACPDRLPCGSAQDWHFIQGVVSFSWDFNAKSFEATIEGNRKAEVRFYLPCINRAWLIESSTEYRLAGNTLTIKLDSGAKVRITTQEVGYI